MRCKKITKYYGKRERFLLNQKGTLAIIREKNIE